MTQDDIVKMALEAGYQSVYLSDVPAGRSYQFLERFAALVVAHEHEKQDELNQLEKTLCSFWRPQKEEVEALTFTYEQVKAHIQAAILTEREACAMVCEELRDEDGYEAWNTECAAAIRQRKNK